LGKKSDWAKKRGVIFNDPLTSKMNDLVIRKTLVFMFLQFEILSDFPSFLSVKLCV